MRGAIFLLLLFFSGHIFANNTIIAVVNNFTISSNLIKTKALNRSSKQEKINTIYLHISKILQLQKAKELNIEASENDINNALLVFAKNNNITIDQLHSYPEFLSLETEVSEKISILNLQRYITKHITIDEDEAINICTKKTSKTIKQIKIAQIIVSEVKTQKPNDQDIAIKAFLNKLSNHIIKGASFKGLAKLHSQHSSYFNGGITDWIEVNNPTIKMLDSLKDSEVSEIYLTDLGFAIAIKLEERFISNNLTKCKEELIYLAAEKFYSNWVSKLQEAAYIKIYHDKL